MRSDTIIVLNIKNLFENVCADFEKSTKKLQALTTKCQYYIFSKSLINEKSSKITAGVIEFVTKLFNALPF